MKIKMLFLLVGMFFGISSFAQSPITGSVVANNVYNDYGAQNISTTNVQIVASLNAQITSIFTFDSSGLLMVLTGTCNGQAQVVWLSRGGSGNQPACFDVGTPVYLKTQSGTASTSGTELIANFFH